MPRPSRRDRVRHLRHRRRPRGIESFRGWIILAAVLDRVSRLGHSMVTNVGSGRPGRSTRTTQCFSLPRSCCKDARPTSCAPSRTAPGPRRVSSCSFRSTLGSFGVINNTEPGNAWLGEQFVRVATTETYPLVVYVYSGFMNLFVPSAGSKWLIEAPYLLPAAAELGVSATTTVLAYAYGDSTTNLIQPFWAIPILTVTGLRFGDVLGYTGIVAIVCMITCEHRSDALDPPDAVKSWRFTHRVLKRPTTLRRPTPDPTADPGSARSRPSPGPSGQSGRRRGHRWRGRSHTPAVARRHSANPPADSTAR